MSAMNGRILHSPFGSAEAMAVLEPEVPTMIGSDSSDLVGSVQQRCGAIEAVLRFDSSICVASSVNTERQHLFMSRVALIRRGSRELRVPEPLPGRVLETYCSGEAQS